MDASPSLRRAAELSCSGCAVAGEGHASRAGLGVEPWETGAVLMDSVSPMLAGSPSRHQCESR